MEYITRDMEKLISELTKEYSCILITGPRQVGKSTMLEHMDNHRTIVTLDDFKKENLPRPIRK